MIEQHRVARSGREQDAVGAVRQHVLGARRARHGGDAAAAPPQVPHDVALHPEVHDNDVRSRPVAVVRALAELVGNRGGDLGDVVLGAVQRLAAQPGERLLRRLVAGDGAHHHAVRAQVARQRARVDAGDRRHAGPGKVLVEASEALPVRGQVGQLADDEAAHLDASALVVAGVEAVVALQRVGHRQDLAAVGGVGKRLLVASHRGVEDHLAGGRDGRAEAIALEDAAVREDEACGRSRLAHDANAFVSSVKLTWYVHASTRGSSETA